MSDYVCPVCRGGFTTPEINGEGPKCPWCHQAMDGSYEDNSRSMSVSKVEEAAAANHRTGDTSFWKGLLR